MRQKLDCNGVRGGGQVSRGNLHNERYFRKCPYLCLLKGQRQDRRVASRQTPYFLQRQKSMQKGLLLRRALLTPVVGVLFNCKVDEYMSAAWHRKPGPAFLNPLNVRAVLFRVTCHENISLFIILDALFGFQTSNLSLQQSQYTATITTTAQQKKQNKTNLVHQELSRINTPTIRERSAQRSAKPSLVTFFGFGKKVTRLSAGTDDLDLPDCAKQA